MLRTGKLAGIGFIVSVLFIVHTQAQQSPSVYLSEIAWAGSSVSTADEWVELVNAENTDIDLSGWKITRLSDGIEKDMVVIEHGRIPAHGNFLIANYVSPKSVLPFTADVVSTGISLANTKLQLKLYDSNNILLDIADDGIGTPLAGSNALKASMERLFPVSDGTKKDSWVSSTILIDSADSSKGYGTPKIAGYPHLTLDQNHLYYNLGMDITIRGTIVSPLYISDELSLEVVCGSQGASVFKNTNGTFSAIVSVSESVSQCTVTLADPRMVSTSTTLQLTQLPLSGMINISEAMPDPSSGEEWIELHNQGVVDIDLIDWELDDIRGSGSKSYVFPHYPIHAGEFVTVQKSVTGIGLNNDGDEVTLLDPLGTIVDTTAYGDAPEDQSWVRLTERSFAWSGSQTPLRENELPERKNYYGLVKVNELVPNPHGSDEAGEWVELLSTSAEPIDLNGWSLDDEEGGSSPYTFPSGSILQPGQYVVITRPTTEIAFNNDDDSVRLFDPIGSLVDSSMYTGAKEGESYAYFKTGWQWTDSLTAGGANQTHQKEISRIESIDTAIAQSPIPDIEITQSVSNQEVIFDEPILTVMLPKKSLINDPVRIPSDMQIPAKTHKEIIPERGFIKGAQTARSRPLPLLIILFSGILISVILGISTLWHTKQLRQNKSSKSTPDSTHPG